MEKKVLECSPRTFYVELANTRVVAGAILQQHTYKEQRRSVRKCTTTMSPAAAEKVNKSERGALALLHAPMAERDEGRRSGNTNAFPRPKKSKRQNKTAPEEFLDP